MNQAGRVAMMRGKRLPYDAEVEYLESTGTQWIDTGFVQTSGTVVTLDMAIQATATSMLNGSLQFMSSTNRRFMMGVSQANKVQFGCDSLYSTSISNDGARHLYEIDVPSLKCRFDGVDVVDISSKPYLNNLSFYLFARNFPYNYAVYDAIVIGRLYGAKFLNAGTLVRDFIPVRFTNENGVSEGAMFDRADPTVGMNPDGTARTDGLYRNRGTGAFIAGQDL